LVLLLARISVAESGMFRDMEARSGLSRGNMLALFTDGKRFLRYLNSILIGVPIWFVVAILITFSPEFAKALRINGPVSAGNAVMYCYLGLVFGDLSSGLISQLFKSRKKAVLLYMLLTIAAIAVYFLQGAASVAFFYWVCFALGFAGGYWAVFVTVAAEQFGTNLRATVATTVPNFVRGMVVPITLLFQLCRRFMGLQASAIAVGALCLAAGFVALACWRRPFTRTWTISRNFCKSPKCRQRTCRKARDFSPFHRRPLPPANRFGVKTVFGFQAVGN